MADLVGALVSLGSFRVPLGLGPYKLPAWPTAIELSIIPNFPMRNHRTFAGRTMIGRTRVRGLKCNAVSLATPIPSRINRGGLPVPFPYAPPVLLRTCAIVPAVVLDRLNFYRAFRDTAPERRRFAATRGGAGNELQTHGRCAPRSRTCHGGWEANGCARRAWRGSESG